MSEAPRPSSPTSESDDSLEVVGTAISITKLPPSLWRLGDYYVLGAFNLIFMALFYFPNLIIILVISHDFYLVGEYVYVYISLGSLFASWFVGVITTLHYVTYGAGRRSTVLLRWTRIISSFLFCRASIEAWVMLAKTKGEQDALIHEERKLAKDFVLRAVLWSIPQMLLGGYVLFTLPEYSRAHFFVAMSSTFITSRLIGRFLQTNFDLFELFSIVITFCSAVATMLQLVSCIVLWRWSAVWIYVVQNIGLLLMSWLLLAWLASWKRLRTCGTDWFVLIFLPLFMAVYATLLPTSLFTHRQHGYARYAFLAYYPLFVWRALILVVTNHFWPWHGTKVILLVLSCLAMAMEFVLSVVATVGIRRWFSTHDAHLEWIKTTLRVLRCAGVRGEESLESFQPIWHHQTNKQEP